METTTETSYVVRYRSPNDATWRRMQFKDGDRTYSEKEADETIAALKSSGFEALRSKYTITREDSA